MPALVVGAVAVLAYAATLAATLPARLVTTRVVLPPQIIDVSGTVWNGRILMRDGFEARWTVLPLRSLFTFALAADWTLTGPETEIGGRAALRPGFATLTDIEGRAGWALVRMAAPAVIIDCDGGAAITIARIALSEAMQGVEGEARTGPASCIDTTSSVPRPVDVPPLTATATIDGDASTVIIATVADPATRLGSITVRNRTIAVTVEPAGARLTQLPSSGPITLEYPF